MKAVCPFFVFKQKTEYELRISDWSSDVCASDLGPSSTSTPRCATLSATPACAMPLPPLPPQAACRDAASMPGRWNLPRTTGAENHDRGGAPARLRAGPAGGTHRRLVAAPPGPPCAGPRVPLPTSEERLVGNGGVSTGRSGWWRVL